MKLYELERDKNIKIYLEDNASWTEENGDEVTLVNPVVIFGHIDGMYSYCWLEKYPDKIVHLNASTPLIKFKDGYKIGENKKHKSMLVAPNTNPKEEI